MPMLYKSTPLASFDIFLMIHSVPLSRRSCVVLVAGLTQRSLL